MGEIGDLKKAKEVCVIKGCMHLLGEAMSHALPPLPFALGASKSQPPSVAKRNKA